MQIKDPEPKVFIRFLDNLIKGKYKKLLSKDKYYYQCDILGEYKDIVLYYIYWEKLFGIEGFLLFKDGKYYWLNSYGHLIINYNDNILISDWYYKDTFRGTLTEIEVEDLELFFSEFERLTVLGNIKVIETAYLWLLDKIKDKE